MEERAQIAITLALPLVMALGLLLRYIDKRKR